MTPTTAAGRRGTARPGVIQPRVARHDARRGGGGRLLDEVMAGCSALAGLVTSPECAVCGDPDTVLCGPCRAELHAETMMPFRAEGRAPALASLPGFRVVAGADYARAVSQAILAHKRRGHVRLARELGAVLNRVLWSAWGQGQDLGQAWLVPVPGSARAFRERGFDPLGLLLGHCAATGLPAGLRVLHPLAVKSVPERLVERLLGPGAAGLDVRFLLTMRGQKGLGAVARRKRLSGSMRLSVRFLLGRNGVPVGARPEELRGRRCVLVDDVLTTGATLLEAARVLEAAGATVCGAVVLAATRPPANSQEEIHEQGVN